MNKLFPMVFLMLLSVCSAESGRPAVVGFGVNSCHSYVAVFEGWEQGDELDVLAYLRYRAWLTGLVTGLSLATNMDVLNGVTVNGAMRRLNVHCGEHPDDDFFTAALDLIGLLSGRQ